MEPYGIMSRIIKINNLKICFVTHFESFQQDIDFITKKPLHCHPYYEVLYSGDNDNMIALDNKSIPFEEHQVVILHPKQMHRAIVSPANRLFSIGFTFTKDSRSSSDCDLFRGFESSFASKAYIMFPPVQKITANFKAMEELSRNSSPYADELMLSTFVNTLFQMMSLLEQSALSDRLVSAKYTVPNQISKGRSDEEMFARIDHLLNRDFDTDITAAALSKKIFLSERQINRHIFSQYSQTFNQRKSYLRINHACKLLLNSDMPISEISEKIGYSSINTFYSAFKQQMGCTPSEYRIQQQTNITNETK